MSVKKERELPRTALNVSTGLVPFDREAFAGLVGDGVLNRLSVSLDTLEPDGPYHRFTEEARGNLDFLAGFKKKAPGFKHFIAAPGVESGIKQVDASLMTGYGKIRSAWQVDGENLTWELAVPANTTATVILPATEIGAVREGGQPVGTQAGIRRPGRPRLICSLKKSSETNRRKSGLPIAGNAANPG